MSAVDRETSAPRRTFQHVSGLSHRMLGLLELQTALLKTDLRDASRAMTIPLSLLFGGAVLGFSCSAVLVVAFGFALGEWTGLPSSAAFAIAALVAAAVAAAALAAGWVLLRKRLALLRRSQRELRNTLARLKEAITHPASSEGDGEPATKTR